MSNQNDEARAAFTKHCQDLNMSEPSRGRRDGFLAGFDAGQRAKALEIADDLEKVLIVCASEGSGVAIYELRQYIEKLKENENG